MIDIFAGRSPEELAEQLYQQHPDINPAKLTLALQKRAQSFPTGTEPQATMPKPDTSGLGIQPPPLSFEQPRPELTLQPPVEGAPPSVGLVPPPNAMSSPALDAMGTGASSGIPWAAFAGALGQMSKNRQQPQAPPQLSMAEERPVGPAAVQGQILQAPFQLPPPAQMQMMPMFGRLKRGY